MIYRISLLSSQHYVWPYPSLSRKTNSILKPQDHKLLMIRLPNAVLPAGHATMSSCCCSVAQSCPTLCEPMDYSTPGFPVLHHLPELTSNSCPSSQWCHPIILPSVVHFSCFQSFPESGSFLMSQLFPEWEWPPLSSGGQSTRASASASVLQKNIQDWFPLGLTGLISL